MDMSDEFYLKQKLEWVKYRLKVLDEVEARLVEMRSIAALARDNDLEMPVKQELNDRLRKLDKQVKELDGQSRIFWMDLQ